MIAEEANGQQTENKKEHAMGDVLNGEIAKNRIGRGKSILDESVMDFSFLSLI